MAKKEEKESKWSAGQIAREVDYVIVNSETEDQLNIYTALAVILNKLERLEQELEG